MNIQSRIENKWYNIGMKILSLLFFMVALCTGCSTTLIRDEPQTVRMGDASLETIALVEALLEQKGTNVQSVNGSWHNNTFQAQCVMKGDGEKLTVIFLAPQMRLVTISVTKPHTIRYERAPRIPSSFEPEYALVDLAFVNLDAPKLRHAVGSVLHIDDDGTTRRISTAAGRVVAEVVRRGDDTCFFKNFLHGYEYELKVIQKTE